MSYIGRLAAAMAVTLVNLPMLGYRGRNDPTAGAYRAAGVPARAVAALEPAWHRFHACPACGSDMDDDGYCDPCAVRAVAQAKRPTPKLVRSR